MVRYNVKVQFLNTDGEEVASFMEENNLYSNVGSEKVNGATEALPQVTHVIQTAEVIRRDKT